MSPRRRIKGNRTAKKSNGCKNGERLEYLPWYIEAGKRVVALNGKVPVETGWQNMPFRYLKDIPIGHWQQENYNFGWVLDSEDLIIDVDRHSDGADGWVSYNQLVEDLGIIRPDEMTPANIKTGGGGFHICLSKPTDVSIRKNHPRYPGIDFLTRVGQVVGVGGIHPGTRRPYKFVRPFDPKKMSRLPEAPDPLLDLLAPNTPADSPILIPPRGKKELEYGRVVAALSHIDPDLDYPEWMKILFGLKSLRDDSVYLEIANAWSSLGGKYEAKGPDTVRNKWATMNKDPMRDRVITIATLFKMAKDCGWSGRADDVGPYYCIEDDPNKVRDSIKSDRLGPVSLPKILATPFPPLRFIVEGLISDVGVMILSSAPKVGKTTLVHQLCLALMLEVPFLGQLNTKPRRILFLALEDSQRRIKRRTEQILAAPEFDFRGPEEALDDLMIVTEWPNAPEGIDELDKWLDQNPDTDLVIIDTLAAFRGLASTGGNNVYQQEYDLIKKIKTIADRHETCVLILHHNRKLQSDTPIESIGGSFGLTGAADGFMVLSAQGLADSEFLLVSQSRETEPQELALKRESFAFKLLGDASRFMMSEERREVVELLEQEPNGLGPLDIANALGRSAPSTRKLLRTMHQRGVIRRVKRGLYVAGDYGNSGNIGNHGN